MPEGRILLKSISESKKLSKLKTDGARLLYTWLIPHLDINGCYFADPEVIKGKVLTRLRKSVKTIKGYLDDLEDCKLIIRYTTNGDDFLIVPDFVDKQPKLRPDREAKPSIPPPTKEQLKGNSGGTQDELRSNANTSKVKISKVKLSKDNVELRKKIIDYFNKITGQKRTYDCDETNKLLNGRIDEGRAFKDFRHVIDTKTSQWLGDKKMQKFLRPSTLFREGNFEDYLNEPYENPRKRDYEPGQRTSEPTPKEKEYYKAREAKEKELKGKGFNEDEIKARIVKWSEDYWKEEG